MSMLPGGKRAGALDCNGGQSKRQRKLDTDSTTAEILCDSIKFAKVCDKGDVEAAASQKLIRKASTCAPAASASATADKIGKHTILLCYLYKKIDDTKELQKWFEDHCRANGITGRVLVSIEGINVNVAGSPSAINRLCSRMDAHPIIGGGVIDYKLDDTELKSPFPDLAVKLSKEVVATGGSMSFDLLSKGGGEHLSPAAFHAVLESYKRAGADNSNKNKSGPDHALKPLVLVDVRNRKEIEFGTFEGAVSSDTKIFSEWTRHFALPRIEELKQKKVLMFCTGGVRCEKASAFLKHKGVEDVSQLSGGIHRYLERYGSEGFFKGSNFVFDARGLQKPQGAAIHGRCFSCSSATEAMSSDRVCAVCRDQVLQCDSCRKSLRGVYFCRDHSHFEGKFFPFLEHFPVSQLRAQQDALKAMAAPGGCLHTQRRRRRALNKQLKRIQNRIDVLTTRAGDGEGGDGDGDEAGSNIAVSDRGVKSTGDGRCRSCGRVCLAVMKLIGVAPDPSTSYCHGDCWGFFQATRRSKGYVSLDDTAMSGKD